MRLLHLINGKGFLSANEVVIRNQIAVLGGLGIATQLEMNKIRGERRLPYTIEQDQRRRNKVRALFWFQQKKLVTTLVKVIQEITPANA
jgi:hypothetical protein